MQRCSHCNAQQMDGAIFCTECGASLLQSAVRNETTTSLGPVVSQAAAPSVPVQRAPVPHPMPAVGKPISLVVLANGRRMDLDASEELLIGRKDNARGIYPDIDLALDGGYESGVSRRHAIITVQNGTCVLEDLDSANGTFINGRRLAPREALPISDGDELKFGSLIVRVELG